MKRLLEVASEHGVDTSAVLRSINMSQEALESSDIYYTVEQHVASIKLIQEAAAIPGLGLLVGLRISIADLGVMGYAMLSSPTLRKAMDVAIRFQSLTDPVLHVSYRVDGNDVVVVVEPLMLLGQAYRYDVEETLAIWQRILGNFFGSGIGCTLVKVTWPQPAHDAMYRNIFRCPVVYSQDVNEFHFPRYLMDQPLGLANDHAARICEEECARLLKSLGRGQTILDSVRRILINSPGRFPDLPTVAKKLRISPRNLRRRLADASTSFREISADVRIHIATQYLSDTSLTVEQIGFLVGYGEASNFHRAFKRHAGLTPLDFRKQHSSA
ncbi:MAG: AraC family transcriptional regulator [Proteobacteria bacterium]|nr:AraC family transcriptional regulator [Pseudomonadota bacterium]